jgi:cytochrome P450
METQGVRRLLLLYTVIYGAGVTAIALAALTVVWLGLAANIWPAFLIAAVILGFLFYVVLSRVREFRSLQHIAGPKPNFFLGNMKDLLSYGHGGRHRALEVLHEEYGALVRLHLAWGSAPFVSLSYASNNIQKRDLDSHRRADRTMLPRSLMGIEGGEEHKAHRQVISPSLTTHSVSDRIYVLKEVSARYVEKWKDIDGAYDGLQSDLHDWSVNCLSTFLFGEDWIEPSDFKHYHHSLAAIEEEVSFRAFHPFFVRWIFPRRLMRVKAAYRDVAAVLDSVMRRRELRVPVTCPAHERPKDLLDQLTFSKSATAARLSHKDRVEELMSLILGGADPMAYVISQALVLLSLNRETQEKAREYAEAGSRAYSDASRRGAGAAGEIENTGPDPFVKNIVYETLRLFPPVPFSAKFSKNHEVVEMEKRIPPGTVIMWMKNVVGKNAQIFRDPDAFNPDRYSARDGERDTTSSFLPFGAGPRHCVGNRLAETQCAVMLAEILKHFRIDPVENADVKFRSTISVLPSTVPVKLVAIQSA